MERTIGNIVGWFYNLQGNWCCWNYRIIVFITLHTITRFVRTKTKRKVFITKNLLLIYSFFSSFFCIINVHLAWLGKKSATSRLDTANQTDFRVKAMNEIIRGILAIKMYVWEKWFQSLIGKIRKNEIKAMRGTAYISASLLIFHVIPKISIFFSLISYVLLGNIITARQVFIITSLFNTINNSMVNFWPLAVSSVAEGFVSAKRIQAFLLIKNIQSQSIMHTDNDPNANKKNKNGNFKEFLPNRQSVAIRMNNVSAFWNDDFGKNGIFDLNLNIVLQEEKDNLYFLIGPVGSGKSTFFSVLLKELNVAVGEFNFTGRVSYSSQEPWLFRGTVRENIVFMDDFDEQR
jgi:ATP-binding cassette, subfamily C (CFTR/MRP), member 4